MANLQVSEAANPDEDPILLEAGWHPLMAQHLEAPGLPQTLDEAAMLAHKPRLRLALPPVVNLRLKLLQP